MLLSWHILAALPSHSVRKLSSGSRNMSFIAASEHIFTDKTNTSEWLQPCSSGEAFLEETLGCRC